MMQWKKSPPELIAVFDAVMPDPPAVRKSMFGYPAAFVNGNMFMGLHQDHFVLRLSEGARQEFLRLPATGIFEPMAGRPMREYVVASPALVSKPAELSRWVAKALEYASSLKPKEKRTGKLRAKNTNARTAKKAIKKRT